MRNFLAPITLLVGIVGVIVSAVLIGFKLAGHLDWSWPAVFLPFFASTILDAVFIGIASLLEGSGRAVSDVASFLGRGRRIRAIVDLGVDPPKRSANSDTWWEAPSQSGQSNPP